MPFIRLLAAALCGLASLTAAHAQITPAPILKIETGMHLGQFRSSAYDLAGRFYLTSAQDRTARLWSMQDGRQLAVLRPPSDGKALGQMGPVALSPDGREAAVSFNGSESNLFIFTTDGALRTATRVPGGALHGLEWTADGKWLIAATDTRVARLDARTLAATTFMDDTYAFGLQARGNTLLLYKYKPDKTNTIIHTCTIDMSAPCRVLVDPAPGYRPTRFHLTPDGRTAIYALNFFQWTPRVDKYVLEVRDIATGRVKLERDGDIDPLLWDSQGNAFSLQDGTLRRYNTAEMQPGPVVGKIQDYAGDLDYLDGKLRYLRKAGKTLELVTAQPGSGAAQRIATVITVLDQPGEAAGFPLQVLATRGISLSVPPRSKTGCSSRADLRGSPPGDFAKLTPGECPNVLVMPDGGAVQSQEFRLRRFNAQGKVLWDVPHSARWTYGMAPSTDGRWIAVRSEDGTLRLMTANEGREVLAVFEQNGRWVMATPTGYYDASPGGEELIGWQVNRGPSELADFFPASRFRSQFNRPDVVAKALETGNEVTALAQANAEAGRKPPAETSIAQVLPPVVEIVSPSGAANASTSPLLVKYTLRSPADAPVTSVRVRINGQALDLPESRNLVATAANATRELSIPIPAQDSEVQVFAENRNGVSTPATLRVSWKGAPPKQQDAFEAKPKLYVLAVGVSDYDNPQYKLGLAAKDAQDFAAALMKQKGALYRDVEVKLLTNKAATQGEVLDGLEWLRKQVTARDVGMLFLAGHGYNDADGVYYFMPVNADLDRLKRTGVVFTEIKNTLSNLAGKALFFVDTCHSGNVLGGGRRAIPQDVTGIINELSSAENGVVVFSSSTGRQFSLEDPAWGNGAFTKALVEGINGKADMNKNGRITHKMLDFYLSERVKELTKGQQTPVTQAPGGVPDFPIAIIR